MSKVPTLAFPNGMATAQPDPGNKTQRQTIKVAVRIRPESSKESGSKRLVSVLDETMLIFDPSDDVKDSTERMGMTPRAKRSRVGVGQRKKKDEMFKFDNVYGPASTQNDVYNHSVKPLVGAVMGGFNSTIFAYGATGAGKTYTMMGTEDSPGVIRLAVQDIFSTVAAHKDETDYIVLMSFLEVYNENIRDLMVHNIGMPVALDVREEGNIGIVVAGLSNPRVTCVEQLVAFIEKGMNSRTQAATDANETSSRSHAVLQITVQHKPKSVDTSAQWNVGKLSLVDLAGSERSASVSRNNKSTMKEGCNINRSLLALGNCINALSQGGGHVPYRDSKLTRLLKDSLGGNCRTAMVACVSPSGIHYEDTYSTLNYASRTKNIKTSLKRNVLSVNFHVTKYASIIEKLKKENADLKDKCAMLESRMGAEANVYAKPLATVPIAEAPADTSTLTQYENAPPPLFQTLKEEIEDVYGLKKSLVSAGSSEAGSNTVKRCIGLSKRMAEASETLGSVLLESLAHLRQAKVAEVEVLQLRKQLEASKAGQGAAGARPGSVLTDTSTAPSLSADDTVSTPSVGPRPSAISTGAALTFLPTSRSLPTNVLNTSQPSTKSSLPTQAASSLPTPAASYLPTPAASSLPTPAASSLPTPAASSLPTPAISLPSSPSVAIYSPAQHTAPDADTAPPAITSQSPSAPLQTKKDIGFRSELPSQRRASLRSSKTRTDAVASITTPAAAKPQVKKTSFALYEDGDKTPASPAPRRKGGLRNADTANTNGASSATRSKRTNSMMVAFEENAVNVVSSDRRGVKKQKLGNGEGAQRVVATRELTTAKEPAFSTSARASRSRARAGSLTTNKQKPAAQAHHRQSAFMASTPRRIHTGFQ